MRGTIAGVILALALAGQALGQDAAWVQIEARQTLSGAQSQARSYAQRLADVSGFSLGGGWYGIALGPYSPEDAQDVLRGLRARGAIPADSYVVDGSGYGQQFWPIGTGISRRVQSVPDGIEDAPAPQETAAPAQTADETLYEARQSEARLTKAEREELQVALDWAGHYQGAIDAAFGPGTRGAMRSWQAAQGFEATGVLTTRQRAALLSAYDAVLDGLDLQTVRDDRAGIAITLPLGAVAFDGYDAPFARYEATDPDLPARVLLISQPGDRDTLAGLYEIMQTLEIVPIDGPRSRNATGFTIEGVGEDIHSATVVGLEDGQIKGFTLIWPTGDEDRRIRVLDEMRASFARLPGVLAPAARAADADRGVDMISGLEIRTPRLTRSGFFVDAQGAVLTSIDAAQDCERITIDDAYEAQPVHADPALGIAVLRPDATLAPRAVARFQTGAPRIEAQVAVAGFPYGGVMSMPAVTFGTLADLQGLDGEDYLRRLALEAEEGDVGGPLLDDSGAVLGVLLPQPRDGGRVLPPEVNFAAQAAAVLQSLSGAGIAAETTAGGATVTPEALTRAAGEMTVLVGCW